MAVLAKTVRPERMAENLAIDDVDLDEGDMAAIVPLETGTSSFFSHRDPAIVQWMAGRKLEIQKKAKRCSYIITSHLLSRSWEIIVKL